MLFVVVDGVPSVGVQVMVGSGKIEKQSVSSAVELPSSSGLSSAQASGSDSSSSSSSKTSGSPEPIRVSGVTASLSMLLMALYLLL